MNATRSRFVPDVLVIRKVRRGMNESHRHMACGRALPSRRRNPHSFRFGEEVNR